MSQPTGRLSDLMDANPFVPPQLFLQNEWRKWVTPLSGEATMYTLWKCAKTGSSSSLPLNSSQSIVLTKGEERGHHGVTLLATFSLVDVKDLSNIVLRHLTGFRRIDKQNGTAEERRPQSLQHGSTTPHRRSQSHQQGWWHLGSPPSRPAVRVQCIHNLLCWTAHVGMEKWHVSLFPPIAEPWSLMSTILNTSPATMPLTAT